MPKYSNSFGGPEYREASIYDDSGHLIGELRIKPSSVSWRPSGMSKYFTVPLGKFHQWITDGLTNASRTAK